MLGNVLDEIVNLPATVVRHGLVALLDPVNGGEAGKKETSNEY